MSTPSQVGLPDCPGDLPAPAQGTWVRTSGGAVGRFVGHTKATTWVWYPRTEAHHGVSFETMCERFDRFLAAREPAPAPNVPATRRVRIGDDWVVGDVLGRREDGTASKFTMRATFIEGPADHMDELGEQIEAEAFDDGGDGAACGILTDHEGMTEFARITSVVNKVILGRRLRGQRPMRKRVWAEVKGKLR